MILEYPFVVSNIVANALSPVSMDALRGGPCKLGAEKVVRSKKIHAYTLITGGEEYNRKWPSTASL